MLSVDIFVAKTFRLFVGQLHYFCGHGREYVRTWLSFNAWRIIQRADRSVLPWLKTPGNQALQPSTSHNPA
jgi:hypothetical protein